MFLRARFFGAVALTVAGILAPAGQVRAAVTGGTLLQAVSTSTSATGNTSDFDFGIDSAVPPSAMSVTSSSSPGANRATATAAATLTNYNGPAFFGDTTAEMLIKMDLTAFVTNRAGDGQGTADSQLGYSFALDQPHPYTMTFAGAGFTGSTFTFSFIGPGGPITNTTGTLPTGVYTLAVQAAITSGMGTPTSTGASMGFEVHVQPVPEPTGLALLAIAGGALMTRRRGRLAARHAAR